MDTVSCKCGVTFDDHKHMVQCSICKFWSHSSCYNISSQTADSKEYVFHCSSCSSCKPCAQAHVQPTFIDVVGSVSNPSSTIANVIPLLVPPGSVSSGSDSPSELESNSCHNQPLSSDASLSILLKRISDLESAHTNDIKSLRLHIVDLEERNVKLEQDIAHLKSLIPPSHSMMSYAKAASSHPSGVFSHRTPNSHHHSSQLRKAATPFRIIWGTQSSCTTDVVTRAILPLTPVGMHSHITVKRSVRTRPDGKHKWWFTIMAPADILSFLDSQWDPLFARAGWCLQASLQHHSYAPGPAASHSSSNNDPSGSLISSQTNSQIRFKKPSATSSQIESAVAGSQQSSSDPPISEERQGNNHEND